MRSGQTGKEGEAITVVLHSCRTGRTTTDKNGKRGRIFCAKNIYSIPGVTIIAPDERDVFFSDPNEAGSAREGGPMQAKYSDENGDYTKEDKNGDHNKELSGEMGNWNVFQGGKQTGQYDGNWTPTASPSWLDNLLYKKK